MAQDDFVFEFTPTSLPVTDFRYINNRGNFHSWILEGLKMSAEVKRIFAPKRIDSIKGPNFSSNFIFFTSWCKIEVDFEFYENISYGKCYFDGFIYTDRVSSRGNKSFVLAWELKSPNYDKTLMTGHQNLVLADIKTRRPVSLPDNMNDYCVKNGIPRKSLFLERLQRGDQIFEYETTVLSSQIDWLHHLNHCEYNKISLDCGASAVKNNFYKFFKDDLNHYHIKSIQKRQLGECFMGDKLKIITWQDDKLPEKIYFKIFKKETDQEVFEMIAIYFKNSLTLAKF